MRRAWPAVAVLLVLAGCARPVAPPPRVIGPVSESTLLASLASAKPERMLEGRGLLRMRAGGEDLPTLNARFLIADSGAGSLQLRPGVLPPVLNLWMGGDSWMLLLPRQKLFSRAAATMKDVMAPGTEFEEMLDTAGGGSRLSSVPVGRLVAYLFAPQAMAGSLERPEIVRHGDEFVLRGPAPAVGEDETEIEVAVDARTLGVPRWSLQTADGESLLRVAYEPPFSGPGFRGSILFLVPALDARGRLECRELRPSDHAPPAAPAAPEEWRYIPPDELPGLVHSLAPRGESR